MELKKKSVRRGGRLPPLAFSTVFDVVEAMDEEWKPKNMEFKHPYIKLLRPRGKANFPFSNSIFIDDDLKVLIDLGAGASIYAPLASRVDLVLLTHHHFDHIHAWPMFNDGRIRVSAEEEFLFYSPEQFNDSNGYSRWSEMMGHNYVRISRQANKLKNPELLAPYRFPEDIELRGVYHDGDIFDCGHVQIQALHLPGHSVGHYGFYFPEEGLIFSADYDLAPSGPWFGGTFCDYQKLVDSLHRIAELKPRLIFGSHRYKVFDQVDQQLYEFMSIPLQRESKILYALAERPRSFKELAAMASMISSDDDKYNVFWDRMMLSRQLDYMVDTGLVRWYDNQFYERIHR